MTIVQIRGKTRPGRHPLSLVILNQTTFHGTIQVTAVDAFGDLGVSSTLHTF